MGHRDEIGTTPGLTRGEPRGILASLARIAASTVNADAAVLSLFDAGGSGPAFQSGYGLSAAESGLMAHPFGLCGDVPGVHVVADMTLDGALCAHPLVTGPRGLRFLACVGLRSDTGQVLGCLSVMDRLPRPGLLAHEEQALLDLATVAALTSHRERRQVRLAQVTNRALRADRMLRLVSEAVTCADALSSLLRQLCRYHGARVGRIWQLFDDDTLKEVSRYTIDPADEDPYYHHPPSKPVTSGNSNTGAAIRNNRPHWLIYSEVTDTSQWVLLGGAIASGLACQVSVPVWVEEQRFGIALAFTRERTDLEEVASDIVALANTIRPALFRKVTEERIRFIAHHDELTQLSNRRAFNDTLARAVAAAPVEGPGPGLLYLDLDGFKAINDIRGHQVGDRLLSSAAARLRAEVGPQDHLPRIGGDEFVVVLAPDRRDQADAASELAQRLIAALARPVEIGGQMLSVGVSIGIALHPADGTTPDELLRSADIALYNAKRTGRNRFSLFEPAMDAQQQERLLMERDLRLAVHAEAFSLAYQPIFDSGSLRVRAVEALLRWDHPVRGSVPPSVFVPVAEETGLIVRLGQWVLETACRAVATLDPGVGLSVNLSPVQFRQPDLAGTIARVLERTGLAPERLELEVTEGLLLDSCSGVLETMRALRARGIRITLDDFGMGYASLSYLRRFPFDRLKIDRSFVKDMAEDDGTMAIVEAILALSRRLQLSVVAEGVETADQLDRLRTLDCTFVQGFFTGRPMTLEALRGVVLSSSRGEDGVIAHA